MKKGLKDFLTRLSTFVLLFFLADYFFKFQGEFPKFPEPEFFGKFLAYIILGVIIFGVIPFLIKLYKKTKIWQNFAKKWQYDKELPDR